MIINKTNEKMSKLMTGTKQEQALCYNYSLTFLVVVQ